MAMILAVCFMPQMAESSYAATNSGKAVDLKVTNSYRTSGSYGYVNLRWGLTDRTDSCTIYEKYSGTGGKYVKKATVKGKKATLKVPRKKIVYFKIRAKYKGSYGPYSDWVSCRAAGGNVTAITITDYSKKIERHATSQFKVKMNGLKSLHQQRWFSSNDSVATVSSSGIVTAVAEGTTEIHCVAHNGKEASVSIKVINLKGTKPQLTVNGKTVYLGESLSDVCATLGNNYTKKRSGEDYMWYIYNYDSNQENLEFVGIKNDKVVAMFTSAVDFSYKDDYISIKDWSKYDFTDKSKDGLEYKTYSDPAADVDVSTDMLDTTGTQLNTVYMIRIDKKWHDEKYWNYKPNGPNSYVEEVCNNSKSETKNMEEDFSDTFIYLQNSLRAKENHRNYEGISDRKMLVKSDNLTSYAKNWANTMAKNRKVYHNENNSYFENCGMNANPIETVNNYFNEIGADKGGQGHRVVMISNEDFAVNTGCAMTYGPNKNGFMYMAMEYSWLK